MIDNDDGMPEETFDGVKRREAVRANTISIKRFSKRLLYVLGQQWPTEINDAYDRPETREDCHQGENAQRPCPFVSCKHNLYLDVNDRTGSIKMNFPHLEVHEMTESCALDIADRGGITLEEIGAVVNLTRERIRQLEVKGLAKLKAEAELHAMGEYLEGETRDPTVGSKQAALTAPDGERVISDPKRWART